MGHKSRNCTSQSAITIMNNWGGGFFFNEKNTCIFASPWTPFLWIPWEVNSWNGGNTAVDKNRSWAQQWSSREWRTVWTRTPLMRGWQGFIDFILHYKAVSKTCLARTQNCISTTHHNTLQTLMLKNLGYTCPMARLDLVISKKKKSYT